ncbi:MAG: arylformamidase [Mycobacterium leprae]
MKLIDITRPLSAASAHWPGDTPFQLQWTWRLDAGEAVNLSSVTLSPHIATHTDAPYHYRADGPTMDQVDLLRYIGPARVVAVVGRERITPADLAALDLAGVERLLIRTDSCPDSKRFYTDFTYLEPEAVHYLAQVGVKLLGTDAHSVDPSDSHELPSHHACGESGILIMENLDLSAVEPGTYELIAFPLKLVGADGSPVRAVLRTLAE